MFKRRKTIEIYTLLYLLTAGLGYGGMLLSGRSLIWKTDGIGQYFPAFLYIGKILRRAGRGWLAGNFSLPFFDLSIGFGEDVMGTLNYYGLGDPLNLIALFSNASNGAFLFTAMFFWRGWLSGLSFLLYGREVGYRGKKACLGAVTYAFCGFAIVGSALYSQWYSLLILLPLLLAGCEQVFRGKKGGWLLLALGSCYGALCGFYFLYNASLLLAPYCVLRLYCRNKEQRIRRILEGSLRCLGGYLLGIAAAGPVFFPAAAAFFGSERAEYSVLEVLLDPKNLVPFFYPEFWKSLLIPVYGTPDLAVGIHLLETVSLIVLFLPRRGKISSRVRQLRLAVILEIAALHLPMTGYLFNAFNEQNNRWIFALHFTLALVFTEMLHTEAGSLPEILHTEAGSLPEMLYTETGSLPERALPEERRRRGLMPEGFRLRCRCPERLRRMWLPLKESVSGGLRPDRQLLHRERLLRWAAVLTVLGVAANIWILYSPLGDDRGKKFIPFDTAWPVYIDSPVMASEVIAEDPELFRIAHTRLTNINGRPANVAMLHGYYSVQYWFSMVNTRVQKLVDFAYGEPKNWRAMGVNDNHALMTLLGIRYKLVKKGDTAPEGWEKVESLTFNGKKWTVVRNPDYRGFAYLRNEAEAEELWQQCMEEGNLQRYYDRMLEVYRETGVPDEEIRERDPEEGASAGQTGLGNNSTGVTRLQKGSDSFSCAALAREGDEIVFALPWHENWRATVDGKRVETECKDIMFLTVPLEAGVHEIRLEYVPRPFRLGCVTASAVVLFLLFRGIRGRRFHRGK